MYKVEVKKNARKSLTKIPLVYQKRILKVLKDLPNNPYPQGCKKLKKEDDLFGYRVGDYRIIYQIKKDKLIIIVIDITHRRDAYN